MTMAMAAPAAPTIALSPRERELLDAYHAHAGYDSAAAACGSSRGSVYRAVLKAGARKFEERIRQTKAQRDAEQAAFLDHATGKTVTADALSYLRSLPSNSTSLVATSIPYNLGKPYGGAPGADRERHLAYHGWMMMVVSEVARVLKDGATAFLQMGMTIDDDGERVPIDTMLFRNMCDARLKFQSRIVWPSVHGLTPKRRLAERYETALVFSKGAVRTWNPSSARTPQKNPAKRAFHGPNRGKLSGHALGAAPTNVWDDIGHLGFNNRESEPAHPAQYPVALPMRAILLWTMPGDLVVDMFNGTGSTQIAAIRSGRAFSGCDLFYENIRARRLAQTDPDTVTPLPGVSESSMAIWAAEARRVDVAPKTTTPEEEDQLVLEFC